MLTMDIAEEGKCSMMLTDVKMSACLCVCVTPLFSSAGLFVAISVGVVVVAAVLMVLVLSLVCAKRLPCHKQPDFFVDSTVSGSVKAAVTPFYIAR